MRAYENSWIVILNFCLGPSIKDVRKILPSFTPPTPLSTGVRIEPPPLPERLASTSIRQNLYCVVNSLRDSGYFLDEWEICEVKNHKLQYIYFFSFWSCDSHRGQAIKYLKLNCVTKCGRPLLLDQHVRMCPLFLDVDAPGPSPTANITVPQDSYQLSTWD